jgi:hypothetical protein
MFALQYTPGLDLPTVTVTEKARADPFTYDEELCKMSTSKIILRWHSIEFESRVRARRAKMWVRILGSGTKSKTRRPSYVEYS